MASLQEWVNGWTRDGADLTADPRRAVYAARHPELTPHDRPADLPIPSPPVPAPPRAPNPVKQVPLTLYQRATTAASVLADTTRRKLETGVAFITEDHILARAAICRECDQFDQIKESCKLCGCGCNGSSTLANKLAHASSECPASPPKWLAVQ